MIGVDEVDPIEASAFASDGWEVSSSFFARHGRSSRLKLNSGHLMDRLIGAIVVDDVLVEKKERESQFEKG